MARFFADVLVVCLIATPNLLLEWLSYRSRSKWLKKYEATIHLVVLLVTLFSDYVFLFPQPNRH